MQVTSEILHINIRINRNIPPPMTFFHMIASSPRESRYDSSKRGQLQEVLVFIGIIGMVFCQVRRHSRACDQGNRQIAGVIWCGMYVFFVWCRGYVCFYSGVGNMCFFIEVQEKCVFTKGTEVLFIHSEAINQTTQSTDHF